MRSIQLFYSALELLRKKLSSCFKTHTPHPIAIGSINHAMLHALCTLRFHSPYPSRLTPGGTSNSHYAPCAMLYAVFEFPLLFAPYASRLAVFCVDITLPVVYSVHQREMEGKINLGKDKDSSPISTNRNARARANTGIYF